MKMRAAILLLLLLVPMCGAQACEHVNIYTELKELKAMVTKLKTNADIMKVAFSAGLTESGVVVSGGNELNLVFSKVTTNVGEAYDSATGFFTAPVKGVYFFRFNVMDHPKYRYMHIMMFKNNDRLMYLDEYDTDGHSTHLSGGITLELAVEDKVNLRLPAGNQLFDDSRNHCIFTGFLVFLL
ncbi:complement C1q tumor necrosis factor-related protein 3-like [Engraulis encrasicolus]|uniref:complement C1q tumor necrosis factor-related protein 3-like n=1 Tax=Engraulis encrasicolus TaxID=184585 RepID=UPI002FCF3103